MVATFLILGTFSVSSAKDCGSGYTWKPKTGVGCVQTNCNDIKDAHWSYVGDCVCGSSGSINENPKDNNKECYYPQTHKACPGCVYACVGIKAECPEAPGLKKTEKETKKNNTKQDTKKDTKQDVKKLDKNQNIKKDKNGLPTWLADAPALTTKASGRTCKRECEKLKAGGKYDEVLEYSGKYPKCRCVVDIRDDKNRLIKSVLAEGDKRTTREFNPSSGALIKKTTISLQAEKERIRERLGYKYDEDQIDALLTDDRLNKWFEFMMDKVDTRTSLVDPQFWWQHFVALLDHGHGNSADFVDINGYGRCGDSMLWLERNLSAAVKLNGKSDNKSEAMLSITGESYGNTLNHTALFIRPQGMGNIEWADIVKELSQKTRAGGLSAKDIEMIDPRLMDARVLDPYFQKKTTVRKFIKGWGVIKIS